MLSCGCGAGRKSCSDAGTGELEREQYWTILTFCTHCDLTTLISGCVRRNCNADVSSFTGLKFGWYPRYTKDVGVAASKGDTLQSVFLIVRQDSRQRARRRDRYCAEV